MKLARRAFGKDYKCIQPWPEDCFVQCGDDGLVISKPMQGVLESENPLKEAVENTSYTTAFFEAFPNNPNTFIRGEGPTVEDAEKSAWDKLQKYMTCKGHIFERRKYTNGAGFCKHCGLFNSKAFEPTTRCCICDLPTWYSMDMNNFHYCKEHVELMPEHAKSQLQLMADRFKKRRLERENSI